MARYLLENPGRPSCLDDVAKHPTEVWSRKRKRRPSSDGQDLDFEKKPAIGRDTPRCIHTPISTCPHNILCLLSAKLGHETKEEEGSGTWESAGAVALVGGDVELANLTNLHSEASLQVCHALCQRRASHRWVANLDEDKDQKHQLQMQGAANACLVPSSDNLNTNKPVR